MPSLEHTTFFIAAERRGIAKWRIRVRIETWSRSQRLASSLVSWNMKS